MTENNEMNTYKFKIGRGANAQVIFEDGDKVNFIAKVAGELARIPPGLPMSMNSGPVVELPNGNEVSGLLQLRRWIING
ncbi:hypothetical protein AK36_6148 (plasmid) [Burkholderia vietnamiensis LMG 10929]|jgi:hypothetical protein|nr:hypothetical protein AK36_6148 [Burkholderia vietnamiensis LMG 10929]AVR13912.1 hypothetical protein A8H33_10100 [Burkholderia vietnamiensis]KVM41641.1 hypothetical protein WJ57_29585 [Burkholderia vietnamiensis]KVS03834.1 hypothetical protein WK30_10705 [Burkholderia vietnamiensis]